MNTAPAYKVNQEYSGQRNLIVPTRMYSRNTLLNAMHIKSDKYLGVNLDRYALTFHSDKTAEKGNPDHEIAFNKIKSLEADVTKADSGKYYLKVHTDEGDLKFKFKNARDFHGIVEALRNTIHNDKPFFEPTDNYKKSVNVKSDIKRSTSPVSSDEEREFTALNEPTVKDIKREYDNKADAALNNYEARKHADKHQFDNFDNQKKREKDMVKDNFNERKEAIDDIKKDQIGLTKDNYEANKDLIESDKYRDDLDKKANRDLYKHNKEDIKNDYDLRRDNISTEYKANKDFDKDAAKQNYKVEKEAAKDIKSNDLAYNRDTYKTNKDAIKETKEVDKEHRELNKDINRDSRDAAKDNIKADARDAKDNLKDDYKQYKHGNEYERDIAKTNMKADIKDAKHDLKDDIHGAKDTRDARY